VKTMQERFDEKVIPEPNSGCYLWTASLSTHGYGRFNRGGGDGQNIGLAHRVAWELERGPIPPGLVVDHLCRNRACVNVQHMEVTTHRVNILRGVAPMALAHMTETCRQGHVGTFKPQLDGWRRCTTCRRMYAQAYYERNRDQLLERKRQYRQAHTEAARAYQRAYRKREPQRHRDLERARHARKRTGAG